MEKTASQKIRLGLFVIFGLLIFILAVYFIGDKQKMFGKTNTSPALQLKSIIGVGLQVKI